MAGKSTGDITDLLVRWNDGDPDAASKLLPVVYAELRKLARGYLRKERQDHTLQATALVHEAYLKLVDQDRVKYQNRLHFYGLAASMMRRVLVDHAREKHVQKRGGDSRKVSLDDVAEVSSHTFEDILKVDEALTALTEKDPQLGKLVELRFFGGFENQEIADFMEVSIPTIVRKWRIAKAWLYRYLAEGPLLEN